MIQARIYGKWRTGAIEHVKKNRIIFIWRKKFWTIKFKDIRWLTDDWYETERRKVS